MGLMLAAQAVTSLSAHSNEPPERVADPRYGVALYHYYLGEHRDALVELMVADSRGGIRGHGETPRVMEGGFSLAYGLDQRAAAIFDKVLVSATEPEARSAAWFYLARMRYLRGDWNGAAEALEKVGDAIPDALEQELLSLRINLAVQQGDLDGATQLLEEEELDEDRLAYVYYNLGAAYSRAGNFAAAVPFYNRVAELPLLTEEARALYDRAMTAAGYSYLQDASYEEAQAQFSRVRLSSPLAGSALLGYGWAAVEQEEYLDALAPWERLAQRSLADENTHEAMVAVPFAYEQLGNRAQALNWFEQAQARFTAELATIAETIEGLREQSLVQALDVESDDPFNWLEQTATRELEPQLIYLAELFSRNSFQGQLQELRDLSALRRNLQSWRDRLDLYSEMLDEREEARVERLNTGYRERLTLQIDTLRTEREQLAEELDQVEREQDFLALLPEGQTDVRERVEALDANIKRLAAAGQDVKEYREAHRRYAGLLLWQASEEFAPRVWRARKQLAALDEELQQLESSRARVEQAAESAADLALYRRRIATEQVRLSRQLDRLDAVVAQLQHDLRSEALAVLEEQRERLRYYLARSRLAIARLYDSAHLEEEP